MKSAPPSAVLSKADEEELRALVRKGVPGTWRGTVARGLFKAWFSYETKPEAGADHFTINGAITVVLCWCLPFSMTYTGTQNARGEAEFKDTYGGWTKWTLRSFNASAKRAEYSFTSGRSQRSRLVPKRTTLRVRRCTQTRRCRSLSLSSCTGIEPPRACTRDACCMLWCTDAGTGRSDGAPAR